MKPLGRQAALNNEESDLMPCSRCFDRHDRARSEIANRHNTRMTPILLIVTIAFRVLTLLGGHI